MLLSTRWTLSLLVLVLAVSVVAAEDVPEGWTPPGPPGGMPAEKDLVPTLRRWLREGNRTEAAWAAWIASERRLGALAPDLIDRLERGGRVAFGEPLVKDNILDALIRMGCSVPARALDAEYRHAAVTVLLCRRPALEPSHLKIFAALEHRDDSVSEPWLGLGNLLARWRVPRFVERVLCMFTARRQVRVYDFDGPYPPWRGPGHSICYDGFRAIPAAYPPVAIWRLSDQPHSGYELLSAGVRPVYARRDVHRPKPKRRVAYGGVASSTPTRDDVRHEWLEGWLQGVERPTYEPWAIVHRKWTGGRQVWRKLLEGVYGRMHGRFRAWRDALFEKGLLDPGALRRLRPRIEIEVFDERDLQRVPLPRWVELEFKPRLPNRARPKPRLYRGV